MAVRHEHHTTERGQRKTRNHRRYDIHSRNCNDQLDGDRNTENNASFYADTDTDAGSNCDTIFSTRLRIRRNQINRARPV